MGSRLQLQTLLSGIPDVAKAYFQAPPADILEYPCIIYTVDDRESSFADNSPYRNTKRYQVTVIDRDPDTKIPDAIAALPLSRFSRRFVANKLHHEVFNLYF
jgi:hypothetical protein